LLLWILDWSGGSGGERGVLSYLSIMRHYDALARGAIDTSDLAYFVLFILAFIVLSVHALDNERLQK
jgi:ABC-2 type transport system permease protein